MCLLLRLRLPLIFSILSYLSDEASRPKRPKGRKRLENEVNMEKGNAKFVRVTPEEQSFIEKMADKYKTSFSGALRMIIEDFISQEQQRNITNKHSMK